MAGPGRAIASRTGAGLVGVVSVTWALAATATAHGAAPSTSVLAGSSLVSAAAVATGWLIVAVGATLVLLPRMNALGLACSGLGVAWFAPALSLDGALPTSGQTFASWASSLPTALLLVVAALLLKPPPVRGLRAIAIAATVFASACTLTRTLFSDPFRDLGCRLRCAPNPFVIIDVGWTRGPLSMIESGFAALFCVSAAVIVSRRPTDRRPVDLQRCALLLALIGWAASAGADALGNPAPAVRTTSGALLVIAVVGLWVRIRRRREALARIAAEAAVITRPDGLQRAIASALGDPTVQVAFRLGTSGRFVDESGGYVPPAIDTKTVRLVRDGRVVALITHSRAAVHDTADFGPTLMLAIENHALRLELNERLEDLQIQRGEVVRRADAHRLALERDLHDGAQQGLLGILLQLHAVRDRVSIAGPRWLEAVDEASAEITAVLAEVREIAHGAHPAILTSAGLDDAVHSLAVRSRVPMDVTGMTAGRLTPAVEQTAFRVVAEAAGEAAAAGATTISLAADRTAGSLRLTVRHDGALTTWSDLLHDRVGATGGRFIEQVGSLEVELPCA